MTHLKQGVHPVQGFGDAWDLGQVFAAQALHELHSVFDQAGVDLGQGGFDDGDLSRQRRVIEVVVQAAAAQRVRQLACAVAGQNDLRDVRGADGADLGHGDLVFGQHFEQKGFKGFVGAVDLVDQQHTRALLADGAQQGALEQIVAAEHIGLAHTASRVFVRFAHADRHQLAAVVPLVSGLRQV